MIKAFEFDFDENLSKKIEELVKKNGFSIDFGVWSFIKGIEIQNFFLNNT